MLTRSFLPVATGLPLMRAMARAICSGVTSGIISIHFVFHLLEQTAQSVAEALEIELFFMFGCLSH